MTEVARSPLGFEGRVETPVIESAALRGNAMGDPHLREVPVYVPPGLGPDERLPVVFLLTGFTGRGQAMLESHPWRLGVAALYDRALVRGELPPCILVMPDAFTKLGGSQYVNSSCLGNYEDYVAGELPVFVDERYPTLPGARAVCGKSSGGFGALRLAMRHPETFRACASISGDCHFEYGYAAEFLTALRRLSDFDGGPEAFLAQFFADPRLKGDDHALLNMIAMSACYSPNPASPLGFDLPVDLRTGERIEEVWRRWLEFDPVVACERHVDALKGLSLLHLEAGTKDEFHLQFSLRILCRRLQELGVPHEHEEHEGGHFDINHRYLHVLPKLVAALG